MAGSRATRGAGVGACAGGIRGLFTNRRSGGGFGPRFGGGAALAGPGGAFGGNCASLTAAERYAKAHGGGAIGVASQSSASAAILSGDANVAGLGGFSGRESTVSASWLAMEVRSGRLRWIVADTSGSGGGVGGGLGGQRGQGGDSRQGSRAALAIAEKVGRKVTVTSGGTTITMYDLQGKASAILAAAGL